MAAVNGPRSTVVSGDLPAVEAVLTLVPEAKRIPVDYASHSVQVERIRDRLLADLAGVVPREPEVAFHSTVTGERESVLDAEYWYRNLRETVRFASVVEGLGSRVFVEVSPHPVLAVGIEDAVVVTTLRRGDGGPRRVHAALAEAWVHGVPVDWRPLYPGARRVPLPTYPFQRSSYWLLPTPARVAGPPTDAWRYRVEWRPLTPPAAVLRGHWLLAGEAPEELVAALTEHGAEVAPWTGELPEREPAGLLSLLGFGDTVALLHRLEGSAFPVWLATTGADTDPEQAMVWGLGVTAGLENRRWVGLLDLPDTLDDRARRAVAAALSGLDGEDQLAVRPTGLAARRLVRAPLGDRTPRRPWRPRGTVLVTGGLGGLGTHVARWLADQGVDHLLLTGRRGQDTPGAADLRALGCEVTVAACDVTDRAALAELVSGHDITAVVHAAGVAQVDLPVTELTSAHLHDLTAAKVVGAEHLDALFADADLDAFVLFSSGAGVWGSGGQSAYAAANAALDAIARRRRATGRTATSIAWGAWAGGMAHGEVRDQLRARGVREMPSADALAALRQAVEHDETAVVVADLDWPRFAPGYTMARRRPLIESVPEVRELAAEPAPPQATGALADRPPAEREHAALDLVRAEAAAVLGHASPDAVPAERPFRELGFDSLTAVELRNRLAAATGTSLPATLVFDHPTASALAAFLAGGRDETPTATQKAASDEPIAIVAMSCRFPGGVGSPEDLWRLVVGEVDAIGPFPADRGWDLDTLFAADPADGGSSAREGGFLHDVADFDAAFFGISPREALAMDPQQRLLLETSWEAFERAGIAPDRVRGSATGVFVGTYYQGYAADAQYGAGGHSERADVAGHLSLGNLPSAVSGRVAYTLGLEGPAVTVETACSSSLVALHLATQSLRQGECDLALAGGAAVNATPAGHIEFSRMLALSPDGRCKPFAAAADGTGWGEGVGVLLLERLSDARRREHPVLAVVRGSAINQDGASNGLTAPNGAAQRRVIARALASAGLTPSDVDVVEAHGTGTALGDPIEAQAVLATYGRDRATPLLLGSVKSNIGHTQGASGLAGVIKAVMSMRHGVVPRTLHIDEPTPHVDWSAGGVELMTETRPWPHERPVRRAAVSSFGGTGTNAHAVLEHSPDPAPEPPATRPAPVPLVLSASTPTALRANARALHDHLSDDAVLPDVAHTLHAGRAALAHRAVVLAGDPDAARGGLAAVAAGDPADHVVRGEVVDNADRVVFVFPGQGSQWVGMAVDLLEDPVFAGRFDECAAALSSYVDWDAREVLGDEAALARVDVVQPALWAVMVSLAAVWRHHGVEPAAVVGHSQGEIAAACVAGALSLEDGARVVALRSRALREIAGLGGMVSVPLPAEDVPAVDGLSVAAVNGPRTTVVSGSTAAVEAVLALVPEAKRIPVDYASHSVQVEGIRDRLLADLAEIVVREPGVPFHSTVTGERESVLDAGYWYRNLRETVRFASVVEALGSRVFVEVSPHPVLVVGIEDGVVVSTLRRGEGGPPRVHAALAEAWAHGVPVDWTPVLPAGRITTLPTYAFQRTRFWLAPHAPRHGGDLGHPFLDTATRLAEGDGLVLTGRLSLDRHPWLADHAVAGVTLLPGTAFVELVARAAAEAGCDHLDELVLENPLRLDGGPVTVQVTVGGEDDTGRRPVAVHSREADEPWTRHATGALSVQPREPQAPPAWPPPGATRLDLDELANQLAAAGYEYGPAFQGLHAAWRVGDQLYAEATTELADAGAFALHPALLDVALRPVGTGVVTQRNGVPRLPFAWHGVRHGTTGARTVRVHLRRSDTVRDGVAVTAVDPDGALVLSAEALVLRPVSTAGLVAARLHHVEWTPAPPRSAPVSRSRTHRLGGGSVREVAAEALRLVRSHLDLDDGTVAVVVTDGAVAARPGEAVRDLGAAAAWGLVRSAQSEHPGRFLLVDTPAPDRVAAVLDLDEPELAVRDGRTLVPRLARGTASPGTLKLDGTVLVTGGSGTLGGLVARHLATRHGVRSLVLASRSGTGPDMSDVDATVRLVACDVADREALRALIDGIDDLTAVVHAAAALDDGVVTALTPERLDTALRPKADAALALDELTRDRDLTAFVLFSSAAALLGSAGQANYAAANAVVDATATRRRAAGLPAVALAWGFWEERSAMTAHLGEADLHRMAGLGLRPLSVEHGLALFDAALAADRPVVVTADLDTATRRRPEAVPALLRGLVRPPAVNGRGARREEPADLATRLTALSAEERDNALVDLVRTQAAAVLGHPDLDAVPPGHPFTRLGFDSLTAVELRNRLAAVTGLRLPATLVFDHPTPTALAAYVGSRLAPATPEAAVLSELDRVLAGVDADLRTEVAVRLRAVLAGWDEPSAGSPADGDAEDLADASDEELFDLIQQEFGKS
nr:type I polyketide synthase [Actinophytocola xanthii]